MFCKPSSCFVSAPNNQDSIVGGGGGGGRGAMDWNLVYGEEAVAYNYNNMMHVS